MANVKIGEVLSVDRLTPETLECISREDFDLLQLVNGGEVWPNLEFLSSQKQKIHRLRLSGIFDRFTGLDNLTELIELDLDDASPDPIFDLSALTKLQICKMAWSPKIIGRAFFSLPELHQVSLLKYKHGDCTEIGLAKKLRVLKLRHSKLESIEGIDACEMLEELRLIQVKGLSSLGEIGACRSLRVIEIEKGSKFVDIAESLTQCSKLTQVLLEGDFEIADLKWMRSNPNMIRFRTDAVVLDVDWNLLFGLAKLREIAIKHIPGTLQSDEEIKAIAGSHGRDIQWIEHGGTRRSPWVEIHFRE